jgi:hypothetical protein
MDNEIADILPETGLWTMEGLAKYLQTQPSNVQEILTKHKIKAIHFGIKYKHRLICLSDITAKIKDLSNANN